MKQIKLIISAVLLMSPLLANADVIYDWEGECLTGCTGTATATLTLMDSYTPGTFLVDSDFVSFSYVSSSGSFSSPSGVAFCCFDVAGTSTLPVLSGPSSDLIVDFAGGGTIFCAPDASGGSTCAGTTAWNMVYNPLGIDDRGRDAGTWALRVPEPGTLALLGIGLLGMGLSRRRKKV